MIAAGFVAVLAIAITTGLATTWWRPPPGPLGDVGLSPISVEFPLAVGQVGTWGNVLPTNPTLEDITIEHIELVGMEGVTVVGMGVNDPSVAGGVGTAYGYPPESVETTAVQGSVLPGAGTANPHVQLLVGVERTEAAGGEIDAILVRYRHEGATYEVTLPFSLRVIGS